MSRQFSEKEAAALLKRAAELQEQASHGRPAEGVSLSDLKHIAQESGIDPMYLEQALQQQAAAPSVQPSQGALERVLRGEVPHDRLDVISEALSSYRGFKPLMQVGRTVQGIVQASWGPVQIEASSRSGRTRVAVRPMLAQTFMMTGYTPALLGFLALILGFALRSPLIGLGIACALGIVSWLITSYGFRKAREGSEEMLEKLSQTLQSELDHLPDEAIAHAGDEVSSQVLRGLT